MREIEKFICLTAHLSLINEWTMANNSIIIIK